MFEDVVFPEAGLPKLCTAQIRKIAYTAPQNTDVDFGIGVALAVRVGVAASRLESRGAAWQGGSGSIASGASTISGLRTKPLRITRFSSPPRAPGGGLQPALPTPHSAPFPSSLWRRSAAPSPST